MAEIAVSEWLKELETLNNTKPDEGNTVLEIAAALQITPDKGRQFLKAGCIAGTIVIGNRVVQRDWDGRCRSYTVYRVGEKR